VGDHAKLHTNFKDRAHQPKPRTHVAFDDWDPEALPKLGCKAKRRNSPHSRAIRADSPSTASGSSASTERLSSSLTNSAIARAPSKCSRRQSPLELGLGSTTRCGDMDGPAWSIRLPEPMVVDALLALDPGHALICLAGGLSVVELTSGAIVQRLTRPLEEGVTHLAFKAVLDDLVLVVAPDSVLALSWDLQARRACVNHVWSTAAESHDWGNAPAIPLPGTGIYSSEVIRGRPMVAVSLESGLVAVLDLRTGEVVATQTVRRGPICLAWTGAELLIFHENGAADLIAWRWLEQEPRVCGGSVTSACVVSGLHRHPVVLTVSCDGLCASLDGSVSFLEPTLKGQPAQAVFLPPSFLFLFSTAHIVVFCLCSRVHRLGELYVGDLPVLPRLVPRGALFHRASSAGCTVVFPSCARGRLDCTDCCSEATVTALVDGKEVIGASRSGTLSSWAMPAPPAWRRRERFLAWRSAVVEHRYAPSSSIAVEIDGDSKE
jgi:hypothetical protein